MARFHLASSNAMPFSDWVAQVERIASRLNGVFITLDHDSRELRACYDVGLTANEVALDFTSWNKGRGK